MENRNRREISPGRAQSNSFSPQGSPNLLAATRPEYGVDPSILDSSFSSGSFPQAEQTSTSHLDSAYAHSAAPLQTLSSTTDMGGGCFLPNSQFNPEAFQHDQSMAFQDSQIFQDRHAQHESNFPFANDPSNMQGPFSDNCSPLISSFDPSLQPNVNPANLSTLSSHNSTPSHVLSSENIHSSAQPASPTSTQGQFYTPQHSRHHSLDPSSAAYPSGSQSNEWQGMSFQQHRREFSEHSDLSSNSASPYISHSDLPEPEQDVSPLISAQQDPTTAFGIENFSINDHSQAQISPAHSPYISPRLMPQQSQSPAFSTDYLLQHDGSIHASGPGPSVYSTPPPNDCGHPTSNHARNASILSDMGQADQFPAPTINIEPAPFSRQTSFDMEMRNQGDTLSPPSRPRGRSNSDPHVGRPSSRHISKSTSPSHRRPSSFESVSDDRSVRSLSPGLGPISRDSSPGSSAGRVMKNRRQSTSSVPNRDYLLGLADPSRPNASASNPSSRGQKHPAKFSCDLCPKRFTRAYNLRSHLRTHTDERPYVCTVCGKAFARQHDRKRHEGLHTGEKRFVCKGQLSTGRPWGCGRKFARADALGRHFRSEAGRECIKPLLQEEAVERAGNELVEQQRQQDRRQDEVHNVAGSLQPVQQPIMVNMDASRGGGFALPAALLAQYPALSNIDWSTIPQGDDGGDLSDVGIGSNHFDGSSGGEMGYDDSDISENYVNNNGLTYAAGDGQGGW